MLTNYPRRAASGPPGNDPPPGKTAGKTRAAPAEQVSDGGRSPIKALDAVLRSMRASSVHVDNPGLVLQRLVDAGFGNLPLPGSGHTLVRWQALAAVAAFDLSLARLFEGHADALAIHAELGVGVPADGSTWGVWCAESPEARLSFFKTEQLERTCVVDGRKAWCPGAQALTYALVSAWNQDGEQCLAAMPINQPGITVSEEGWQAVGMQRSACMDVIFDGAVGVPVGMPDAYRSRPGFWHGSAGTAACWYGAAVEIARRLHQAMSGGGDLHGKAHLGAVDVALRTAAAVLRETAAFIDANPAADAMQAALRTRLGVEHAANIVIEHATRAVGIEPLYRDAHFARMVADLPVYLRQSYAERDLQALGESLVEARPGPDEKRQPSVPIELTTEQWKL